MLNEQELETIAAQYASGWELTTDASPGECLTGPNPRYVLARNATILHVGTCNDVEHWTQAQYVARLQEILSILDEDQKQARSSWMDEEDENEDE